MNRKLWLGLIIGLVLALGIVLSSSAQKTPYNATWRDYCPSIDEVIDKLAKCESNQVPDVVIIDSNGLQSLGWLQFQRTTFDYYGEKYGLPHNDILSPAQQIPIARAMLQDGLWKAWYVCLKKWYN
jgi:hypothetical protein